MIKNLLKDNPIDIARMFPLIGNFFGNTNIMMEACQNAKRSNANEIRFNWIEHNDEDPAIGNIKLLKIRDNGIGCEDPNNLLILARTGHSDSVIANENPAGWGIYYFLHVSNYVMFASKFGTLKVDTAKFFSNKEYRDTLMDTVDESEKFEGFQMVCEIKKEFEKMIGLDQGLCFGVPNSIDEGAVCTKDAAGIIAQNRIEDATGWYGMDVFVNNIKMGCRTPEDVIGKGIPMGVVSYKGNSFYYSRAFYNVANRRAYTISKTVVPLLVIYHGQPIMLGTSQQQSENFGVLVITNGQPLDPVFPDRKSFQKNDKYDEFIQFVTDKAADCLVNIINNTDDILTEKQLSFDSFMKRNFIDNIRVNAIFSLNALIGDPNIKLTEYEKKVDILEKLEYYCKVSEQVFHKEEYYDSYPKLTINFQKPEDGSKHVIKSFTYGVLKIIDDSSKTDPEVFFEEDASETLVPDGTFYAESLEVKYHPSWIEIVKEEINILIEAKLVYEGNYKWYQGDVISAPWGVQQCSSLASYNYSEGTFVSFTKDPAESSELVSAFKMATYSDNNGSIEEHDDYIDELVDADIANLKQSYTIQELFNEFKKVDIINNNSSVRHIKSIDVNAEESVLVVKYWNIKLKKMEETKIKFTDYTAFTDIKITDMEV